MGIYATFNEDGLPLAFYDEGLHGLRLVPVFGAAPEPTDEEPHPLPPILGSKPNPDCMIPTDAVELTSEQYMEFINNSGLRRWQNGQVVDYTPPTPLLTIDDFSAAIQAHLDAKARERDYDDMWSAITYRDDPNPQFAAEGQALFEWRSNVWTYATEQLAAVMAGEREQPTIEEFIAELPAFTWPDLPASQPA